MTARFITSLARRTRVCEAHGDVVEVRVSHDARVIDKGFYMSVSTYACTFADGAAKTYWLRGGIPTEIRKGN